MSDTQRIISAENAERIKNLLVPEKDRESVRPVLWPEDKIQDLFLSVEQAELRCMEVCQRNVAHFVCMSEIIRLLVVRTRIFDGIHLLSIDDMIIPYDMVFDSPIHMITRLLLGNEKGIRATLNLSKGNQEIMRNANIQVYTFKQFAETVPVKSDEQAAFVMARVLEYYAFSPYTTFRQRPTFKQALSKDPAARKWSAIEIVNLRIPKRRPDAQIGTGKKLDMRISVSEHLRRQPTKNGIKLITIAEHMRGPENAPVKPRAKKVYKVVK
jgi:hypothetical protein